AVSQVSEQLIRMITMVLLVYLLVPYGLGRAAAGATFGAVTGSMTGLVVLLYIYHKKRKNIWSFINEDFTGKNQVQSDNSWRIVKEIAELGIPITFGALVLPLMTLVDTIIVPQRLQIAGYAIEKSTELFGNFAALAMTLVNFPTIITISLAASLVPAISEAFALRKDRLICGRTQTGLRLTILVTLPAATGLFVMAEPLTTVIFAESAAAIPLRIVAWGVVFIGLQQTSSAILQGIGYTGIPARNLLIGAICNGIINYILTANPVFGIRGAALGTVTGFAIAAFLNLYSVKKYTSFKFEPVELIFKPLLAVGLMGIITAKGFELVDRLMVNIIPYNYHVSTFLMVAVAVIIYLIILFSIKSIRYSDLKLIPGVGQRIALILKKIGLLRE
ncbi:MAG: putative polysaccharide biosynthesis protein, partial [Halanaerobiaceae bacterium]